MVHVVELRVFFKIIKLHQNLLLIQLQNQQHLHQCLQVYQVDNHLVHQLIFHLQNLQECHLLNLVVRLQANQVELR